MLTTLAHYVHDPAWLALGVALGVLLTCAAAGFARRKNRR